jgi:TPR repeat protein
LKILASNGDIKSIVEIARKLLDGEEKINEIENYDDKSVTIEEESARLWLEIAAIDHEDAEAQFLLALLLDEINKKQTQSIAQTGEEVLKEIQQARKAAIAKKKYKMSKNINKIDEDVIKIEKTVTPITLLRQAANQGHGKAMCYLGNKLLEKGDVLDAINWYKLASSTNPPIVDALYNLGSLYYEGRSPVLEIDLDLSLSYFKKAAEAGDLSACFWCGYCYMTCSGGVTNIDPNKAVIYLTRAANEGNGAAHYHLATVYRSGLSDGCSNQSECKHKEILEIKPNMELFNFHLNKAVELEDPDAIFCMADMLFNGLDGIHKDIDKAKELYEKASALNHIESTVVLGALHYNGLGGFKRDPFKAFELYNKAAENGSLEAWRNLASMYYLGDGIEKSVDMAKQIMKNVFGKEIN